jgi:hypothetical protein
MALEHTGMAEASVMNVRDRPLAESYEIHDVGERYLTAQLEAHGFAVESFGDDARHAEQVVYGDGPDLKVCRDDETLAYIEIKVKTSPEWFGRCNRRHFTEYANFAGEHDTPVFIWFGLIDDADRLQRSAFFRVTGTDDIDGDVITVSDRSVVFPAEATYEIDSETDERVLAVDADDVLGVRPRDTIVDTIPSVHGNDVVCLNEDQLRSFPHFRHVIE